MHHNPTIVIRSPVPDHGVERASSRACSPSGCGHRINVWLVVTVVLVIGANASAAAESDAVLLNGLRQRRLFHLAEAQCRLVLERADIDQRTRAEWSVELLTTETAAALNTSAKRRADAWQAVHARATELRNTNAGSPFAIRLEFQDALTWLAEGELLRMEAEVARQPAAARQQARTTIREAIQRLQELDRKLARQLVAHVPPQNGKPGPTEAELFSLQSHVRFQLGRAYRNQGLCYPPDSNDRLAALSRAVDQLRQTRNQLRVGDALVWRISLDQAASYRLLGSLARAEQALATPLEDTAPLDVQQRAHAEQIGIMLASGHPEAALERMKTLSFDPRARPPELAFAELQVYVALWTQAAHAGKTVPAKQWQEKVTTTVRQLENQYGVYWGRRAELLLLATADRTQSADNVDILERTADDLYLKKRFQEAVAALDRAVQQARVVDAPQRAFDLELKAALFLQKDGQYIGASERLEKLSRDQPDNSKTPKTHLLAAWSLAQAARTNAALVGDYAQLLEDHVARWPLDPTSATAQLWLGKLREGQRDLRRALTAYQRVDSAAQEHSAAIDGAIRCWQTLLEELHRAGQPLQVDAIHAAKFLESVIRSPEAKWPRQWSVAQQQAALAAARIRLCYTPDPGDGTLELLNAALQFNRTAPAAWQDSAQLLRVAALATLADRRGEARSALSRMRLKSMEREWDLLLLLDKIVAQATGEVRQSVAQLLLVALRRFATLDSKLDPSQRARLDKIRATTLLAAGDNDRAIEAFQQLAAEYPDDRDIQVQFAILLLGRSERASLRRALDQWRRVAKRVPPNSDVWYQAKLGIAQAYIKLGDPVAARDRLAYLQVTSQIAKSPDWNRAAEKLLTQARAAAEKTPAHPR